MSEPYMPPVSPLKIAAFPLHLKYYWSDQMKKDVMGCAYSRLSDKNSYSARETESQIGGLHDEGASPFCFSTISVL
jgi:hypothetical protein